MSTAALVEPTAPESSSPARSSPERGDLDDNNNRRFWDLRGVQWRTDLGVLPSSSSADDVRRVTANSRRSYASLRRRLLIDPLIPKDGSNFPDLTMDNPLSQDPDSMWGRFFQKAELEKMVDQDLSRLYPEHGSYFQTPGCQAMLRRILLLWCIRHPNYGYRQGMHELLAPLLFVLQADVERLSAVRKLYKHYFTDNFDGLSFHETDSAYMSNLKQISQHIEDDSSGIQENGATVNNLDDLDPKIRTIISFSDAYGAEGELGIVLSERFMEHDAYCMFDALMNGAGGAVAMANFFSPSPLNGPQNGLPPVIEASSVLYRLLAVVDTSLYAHLVELGVEPQYFALRWLRVLYGREFGLGDLLVIWDEIFSFENRRLDGVSESDPELSFGGLNSTRGAFIAALGVSMILYIRSSILATETATSCLQRLLNFPSDVNLGKLMKKAKSLVALAIDAMKSMAPTVVHSERISDRSKLAVSRGHNLSVDLSPLGTGKPVVRDSYWEEKWRVLHKEEEEKHTAPRKQAENHRPKGWSEKVKLRLLRTESDPSSSKARHEKAGPSRPPVRRNLLDDLARQLGLEEEIEKTVSEDESTKRSLSGNGGSEENSSIFSDPPSPTGGDANDNDRENDSEHSSVASNLSVVEHDPDPSEPSPAVEESCSVAIQEVDSPLPVSEAPESAPLPPVQNEDSVGKLGLNLKERISLAGKFQWFWKFGKNGGEGSVEKDGDVSDPTKASIVESETAASVTDVKSGNQSTMCSLKNLGKSMVENLQVIESVIQQQENGETGSKKAMLVDRGQMTAMAALKELRKISNILSEM